MVREGEVYGNLVFPGEEETTRSYHVTTDDGGEYWRNRRMLLKSAEHEPVADDIHPEFLMKPLQQGLKNTPSP